MLEQIYFLGHVGWKHLGAVLNFFDIIERLVLLWSLEVVDLILAQCSIDRGHIVVEQADDSIVELYCYSVFEAHVNPLLNPHNRHDYFLLLFSFVFNCFNLRLRHHFLEVLEGFITTKRQSHEFVSLPLRIGYDSLEPPLSNGFINLHLVHEQVVRLIAVVGVVVRSVVVDLQILLIHFAWSLLDELRRQLRRNIFHWVVDKLVRQDFCYFNALRRVFSQQF